MELHLKMMEKNCRKIFRVFIRLIYYHENYGYIKRASRQKRFYFLFARSGKSDESKLEIFVTDYFFPLFKLKVSRETYGL